MLFARGKDTTCGCGTSRTMQEWRDSFRLGDVRLNCFWFVSTREAEARVRVRGWEGKRVGGRKVGGRAEGGGVGGLTQQCKAARE